MPLGSAARANLRTSSSGDRIKASPSNERLSDAPAIASKSTTTTSKAPDDTTLTMTRASCVREGRTTSIRAGSTPAAMTPGACKVPSGSSHADHAVGARACPARTAASAKLVAPPRSPRAVSSTSPRGSPPSGKISLSSGHARVKGEALSPSPASRKIRRVSRCVKFPMRCVRISPSAGRFGFARPERSADKSTEPSEEAAITERDSRYFERVLRPAHTTSDGRNERSPA